MKSKALCPFVLLVPFVVLATGCASLEPFAKPEVSLVSVQFADLTLFESSGVFTIRVSNENPEPLSVEGGVYSLYLGGLKIGRGLSDRIIEVPRLGTATDEVEVHINNLALATRLIGLFEEPAIDYRIKSKLYVRRPYGLRTMKFSNEGRMELPMDRKEGKPLMLQELVPQVSPEID